MNEIYMSNEARAMRGGKTEAKAIVREFGDPNSGDYQDPYEEAVKPDATQQSASKRADIEAVRAEFDAMIRKANGSRVQ